MKRRDLILSIIALCQDFNEFGRTSMQKVAYWAGRYFGFNLGHHAYFYGPFSPVIEQDVEALVLSGLVEEKSQTLGVNRDGWDISKYEYSLTEGGRERLKLLTTAYPDQLEELKVFVDQLVEAAGGLHQSVLAPATKLLFIEKAEGRKLTDEEITVAAKNLGWKLTEDEVQRVRRVIDNLSPSLLPT